MWFPKGAAVHGSVSPSHFGGNAAELAVPQVSCLRSGALLFGLGRRLRYQKPLELSNGKQPSAGGGIRYPIFRQSKTWNARPTLEPCVTVPRRVVGSHRSCN